MKTEIDLFKDFTAEERMTRVGGEKLRKKILSFSKDSRISIQAHHKPIASVSFWDEGIAKLILEGWTSDDIQRRLQFKEIHSGDQKIIDRLVEDRESGKIR